MSNIINILNYFIVVSIFWFFIAYVKIITMKNNEQQEIELFKFIDKVKIKCEDSINSNNTAKELQEEIANMCLHCLLPASSDCEICN